MGMTQDLRPVEVRNSTNGEIGFFTLTRAGLYQLAKLLAQGTDGDTPSSYLDCILYDDKIANLFSNHSCNSFARIRRSLLNRFENRDYNYKAFAIVNARYARDGRFYFIEDTFNVGAYVFPRTWKKYYKKCQECGEFYFDSEAMIDDGLFNKLRHIPMELIGYGDECNDCYLRNNYEMAQCIDCHCFTDSFEEIDGDILCRDCLEENYHQCECCGAWVHNDDVVWAGDYAYCSDDCACDDGWHWSDYYDEYRRDGDDDDENCGIDSIINDYHSHSYYPYGTEYVRKNQKHELYIGRETEVDGQDRYDYDEDYYNNLLKLLDGSCFFETDGSLYSGFEIITQPMTEKSFFKTDWNKAFSKLISDGWRSHDTDTCGTHFHFSRWYLGYNDNEIHNNAKKVCRFFQLFADDIRKIARRDYGHYCYDMNDYGQDIDVDTDYYRLADDRYWSVNLTNLDKCRKGTIEIRICKGTLKVNTMLASADFFLHIVRNAKRISWKNIENLDLWLKGIKNKNTIEYIKARHAFDGAF